MIFLLLSCTPILEANASLLKCNSKCNSEKKKKILGARKRERERDSKNEMEIERTNEVDSESERFKERERKIDKDGERREYTEYRMIDG